MTLDELKLLIMEVVVQERSSNQSYRDIRKVDLHYSLKYAQWIEKNRKSKYLCLRGANDIKLGINPGTKTGSSFRTPMGTYAYPLFDDMVWNWLTTEHSTFITNAKYIFLLKPANIDKVLNCDESVTQEFENKINEYLNSIGVTRKSSKSHKEIYPYVTDINSVEYYDINNKKLIDKRLTSIYNKIFHDALGYESVYGDLWKPTHKEMVFFNPSYIDTLHVSESTKHEWDIFTK